MDEREIRAWMRAHVGRFEDRKTGEIDCTAMVETWDREMSNGKSTVDTDHPAWDIAVRVEMERPK